MRKKIGIIAEYNPFHNGHLYQIKKIRKMYDNPIIILVMSGNFTQRGEPSIINKWDKANIALLNGIDLIVELPFYYAVSSADIFAEGAMKILNELKIDTIVFGSESNEIDKLINVAKYTITNEYKEKLDKYINSSISYPKANYLVIKDKFNYKLNKPNDILGLSYIKQIISNNYNITPVSIKRTNDYHSKDLNNKISSATSIREALEKDINIKGFVPENSLMFYNNLHFRNDYFKYLKWTIINNYNDLERYVLVNTEISSRIKKYIHKSNSYDELIKNIKTKRYTYQAISRVLNNILCGYTKVDQEVLKDKPYIRLLGFNKNGKDHLNKVKKDISINFYSKFEDNFELNHDIKTTLVYNIIHNEDIKLQYKKKPIIK